jgi:regulator of protease activity HflC (stomatin/prohibitin superfamily)
MAHEIPTKIVINCSTGVREVLELTQAEIDEREAMAIQSEADRVADEEAAEAKAEAKALGVAKLAELGLTVEEISAITGA